MLSGPSGVGKGAVCGILFTQLKNVVKSVSVTTRSPREGEVDGANYHFRTQQQYLEIKDKGGFLETFEIYGNYYGTPKEFVEKNINEGKGVLLEIDVQGALAVKEKMPDAILIFLAPPSIDDLKLRLKKRNSEDETSYQRRITSAETEMRHKERYDYVVVNDDLQSAAQKVAHIIKQYID